MEIGRDPKGSPFFVGKSKKRYAYKKERKKYKK